MSLKNLNVLSIIIAIILVTNVKFGKGNNVVGPNLKSDADYANALTEKIASNRTIVVCLSGTGDYRTIQEAIDAVPNENPNWITISLKKGIYREKVRIPHSKPHIFLKGNGKGETHIVWSQSAKRNLESATFRAEAPYFIAFGISFRNEAPTGEAYTSQNQSVAAYVGADMVSFYQCGFFSTHNTLFDQKGRHYYQGCYIQGSIDFIFGRARTIFHECEIFVLVDRRIKIHGSIAAHSREKEDPSGYVFNKGKIFGTGQIYLGRATGPYSRVIFANNYFSGVVTSKGWTNWSYNGPTDNICHGEYENNGPGSVMGERAPWTKSLSAEEVAPSISMDFIDAKKWVPVWVE